MLPEHIQEIIDGAGNRSPIFFCNIDFYITKNRKKIPHSATKIVCKGTIEEIKKSTFTKKRVLKSHFNGMSAVQKKINAFDLSKIEIRTVHVLKFLGYGVK